jgi:hypothetical protein
MPNPVFKPATDCSAVRRELEKAKLQRLKRMDQDFL